MGNVTLVREVASMADSGIEAVWVNVTEGAQRSGYNRDHMIKLVMKIWKKPETEREIQLRKRTNGYELWLPDLMNYVENIGHGPKKKRKPQTA